MSTGIAILLCVVALVLGAGISGVICFKQGVSYRKKTAEAAVGSAEKEESKFQDRNAGSSRRKNPLTKSWTILRRKRRHSSPSSSQPTRKWLRQTG